MEPPEKMKRKKTTAKKKDPSPQPTCPSFSLLPDEISVNCLARIPRSYYPRLSFVSKSFRSFLSSPELYAERSHLGSTEECLYICLLDPSYQFPQWFLFWKNPNRTQKKRKKTIGKVLVPIPSSDFPSLTKYPAVFGSEIYIIGGPVDKAPSSAVRVLDCRSHTWRDAPSMNVARMNALTCVYDGKIYVIGGLKEDDDESSYAEVFHTETRTWECLPDPGAEVRKCNIYGIAGIAEIEGTINFGNGDYMYGYNTKQGNWESCVNIRATFARSGCVMDNVSYAYRPYDFWWYDINGGYYIRLNGLLSLRKMYKRNGGSELNTTKLASCGGKLYLMWEGYMKYNPSNRKKIWCAEISVEKRHGSEIWGNVEWVDFVHTVPESCELLHVLAVSV